MLKLEEVRKNYHHDRGVMRVNITINPNQLYLFVGENGSGKSTTLKLIARVIFHASKDGKMQNEFQRIIYLPDKRSYPKLLNVKTYLSYYLGKQKDLEAIDAFMKRYQLENKKLGGLSKGMLQKVGLLQTVLNEGDLYLFDEPTDGLDKESIQFFIEDIQSLLSRGKTVIISTHNKLIFKELKPNVLQFKKGVCVEK